MDACFECILFCGLAFVLVELVKNDVIDITFGKFLVRVRVKTMKMVRGAKKEFWGSISWPHTSWWPCLDASNAYALPCSSPSFIERGSGKSLIKSSMTRDFGPLSPCLWFMALRRKQHSLVNESCILSKKSHL